MLSCQKKNGCQKKKKPRCAFSAHNVVFTKHALALRRTLWSSAGFCNLGQIYLYACWVEQSTGIGTHLTGILMSPVIPSPPMPNAWAWKTGYQVHLSTLDTTSGPPHSQTEGHLATHEPHYLFLVFCGNCRHHRHKIGALLLTAASTHQTLHMAGEKLAQPACTTAP
jgi:hypothetical protein